LRETKKNLLRLCRCSEGGGGRGRRRLPKGKRPVGGGTINEKGEKERDTHSRRRGEDAPLRILKKRRGTPLGKKKKEKTKTTKPPKRKRRNFYSPPAQKERGRRPLRRR